MLDHAFVTLLFAVVLVELFFRIIHVLFDRAGLVARPYRQIPTGIHVARRNFAIERSSRQRNPGLKRG